MQKTTNPLLTARRERTMVRSLRTVLILFVFAAAVAKAAETPPKLPYAGEITSDGVRIRGGDGITYLILAHAESGQCVTVRGERFGWLAIDVPDSCTVWVHKSMVKKEDGAGTAKVIRDRVNIRARAEAKADILGQVPVGTELKVVDEDGDWVGVAAPPQARAWVHSKFVRKAGPVPAGPPKPAVVKGAMDRDAGARLLNQAAALYRKELAKPSGERKLDDVVGMYQKIATSCQDRKIAAQAEQARQRLLKIMDLIAAVNKADASVKAFEEKYNKLEAEYERRAKTSE